MPYICLMSYICPLCLIWVALLRPLSICFYFCSCFHASSKDNYFGRGLVTLWEALSVNLSVRLFEEGRWIGVVRLFPTLQDDIATPRYLLSIGWRHLLTSSLNHVNTASLDDSLSLSSKSAAELQWSRVRYCVNRGFFKRWRIMEKLLKATSANPSIKVWTLWRNFSLHLPLAWYHMFQQKYIRQITGKEW